jgi:hypothetical protein
MPITERKKGSGVNNQQQKRRTLHITTLHTQNLGKIMHKPCQRREIQVRHGFGTSTAFSFFAFCGRINNSEPSA